MRLPFEMSFEEVQADLDGYVDAVFISLTSDFLVLPKGPSFVEYPVFELGYEALKRATEGFRSMDAEAVIALAFQVPMSIIVLRCVLGFTLPEWAYLTTQRTGVDVPQGAARDFDKQFRAADPLHRVGKVTRDRVTALVTTACALITEGAPETDPALIHRLQKADTGEGLKGVQGLADLGVPYPILLYERFLGRPFASHRDAVSGLVGDVVEGAIETVLAEHGISCRKTKRAERIAGFEQAPDFIIPNEFNPRVVIEAKQAEDDGTARDKVTRVEHLRTLSLQGYPVNQPRYELVACIAGRGFGVRREDMRKLLVATQGKVFTLQSISQLIEHTGLNAFVTKTPEKES
jgi:hypothetical protein